MTAAARVGVAVDPPLLADLLVRLLSGPNRLLCRRKSSGPLGCDVAIVSPSLEGSIIAPRVIRLPGDDDDAGVGAVTTRMVLFQLRSEMSRLSAVSSPPIYPANSSPSHRLKEKRCSWSLGRSAASL